MVTDALLDPPELLAVYVYVVLLPGETVALPPNRLDVVSVTPGKDALDNPIPDALQDNVDLPGAIYDAGDADKLTVGLA